MCGSLGGPPGNLFPAGYLAAPQRPSKDPPKALRPTLLPRDRATSRSGPSTPDTPWPRPSAWPARRRPSGSTRRDLPW
ncbi:hypothetical protein B9W61_20920 [Streptomyces sp. CS057]|nr:hypothetical protein B9W61_20920 [Streptomyces sp. CS057]